MSFSSAEKATILLGITQCQSFLQNYSYQLIDLYAMEPTINEQGRNDILWQNKWITENKKIILYTEWLGKVLFVSD